MIPIILHIYHTHHIGDKCPSNSCIHNSHNIIESNPSTWRISAFFNQIYSIIKVVSNIWAPCSSELNIIAWVKKTQIRMGYPIAYALEAIFVILNLSLPDRSQPAALAAPTPGSDKACLVFSPAPDCRGCWRHHPTPGSQMTGRPPID